MRIFFDEAQNGRAPPQYMSAVWAQSDTQAAAAKRIATASGKSDIPVMQSAPWYDAEKYHQKYFSNSRF